MPNTKIVLNSQSDLILTGAQLLEPSGLVQGDIEGLVAQLAAIDKAAMNEASLRTAADSSLEAKIDADISTEKAAGDAADQSLEAKIDADVSTEKAAREAAVSTEKARIDAILDASQFDKIEDFLTSRRNYLFKITKYSKEQYLDINNDRISFVESKKAEYLEKIKDLEKIKEEV